MHKASVPVLRLLLLVIVGPHWPSQTFVSKPQMLKPFVSKNYNTDAKSKDIDPATNPASVAQKAAKYKEQNHRQMAIAMFGMLTYTHSKYSNYYQVVMGYHVFASGVKKCTMKTFH